MNLQKNWKVALYLAVIFIVGGITGSLVTLQILKYTVHSHRHSQDWSARMMKRLESNLKLTPEQVQKIKPIVDQSVGELKAIRSKTIYESSQVIHRAEERISLELTPDQQKRFQEIQQERRKHFKERFGSKSD
jgi:Spy/CpxP family protein refolding chaperone